MLNNTQWTEAYKTAEKAIRSTCGKYGARISNDDVADLKQSAMVKLLEGFQADKGSLAGYAWRVASNETTDYLRGRKVGAIKNDANSLTTTDDDGMSVDMDLADDSRNPRAMLEAAELDRDLTLAINGMESASMRQGLKAFLSDSEAPLAGNDRVSKLRACEAISESLKASHLNRTAPKANKIKRIKSHRATKIEAEPEEIRGLLMLSTISTWRYICETTRFVVLPEVAA